MSEHIASQLTAALETMRHDFHFPGHLLPGTAFITLGVWWSWNAFRVYNENEQRKNSENLLNRYKNDDDSEFISFQSTYSGHLVRFLYCEGSYKMMYATFDLLCHLLVVFYGGDLTDEWQHMTVYVFFILNGIIDLILSLRLYKMPNGVDYMASSITWAAFGFLFISHTHGKTNVSIFYHQVLGWMAVTIAVVTLLQYKYDKNVLAALTRGGLCILAGTWLYQIAFSFHNPLVAANQYRNIVHNKASLDQMIDTNNPLAHQMDTSMETMNAVTIFTWHVILVCSAIVFLGVVAGRRKRVYYKVIRNSFV